MEKESVQAMKLKKDKLIAFATMLSIKSLNVKESELLIEISDNIGLTLKTLLEFEVSENTSFSEFIELIQSSSDYLDGAWKDIEDYVKKQ